MFSELVSSAGGGAAGAQDVAVGQPPRAALSQGKTDLLPLPLPGNNPNKIRDGGEGGIRTLAVY